MHQHQPDLRIKRMHEISKNEACKEIGIVTYTQQEKSTFNTKLE